MKPNEQVIEELKAEKAELDGKIVSLTGFVNSQAEKNPKVVTERHFTLLRDQLDAMRVYGFFISERIADLKGENNG